MTDLPELPADVAAVLAEFDFTYDDLRLELRHEPCGGNAIATTFALGIDRLPFAVEVADPTLGVLAAAALAHVPHCPGPPPPTDPIVRRPCGAVHAGMCELVSRTPDDEEPGEWITYRHEDGEGRVFHFGGAFEGP